MASGNNQLTIADHLAGPKFQQCIAEILPEHCKPERMVRIALSALRKTPKLRECNQESFFSAMIELSKYGLEPDDRLAHLIPYGKECKVILGYKGLAQLAMESGKISNIQTEVVCDNDEFSYRNGVINHAINFKEDRGEVYAVYCTVTFKDGAQKSEVMSRGDVERVRRMFAGKNSEAWKNHWNEMAKKTVFRRCSKWLPLSPRISVSEWKNEPQVEHSNPVDFLGEEFKTIEATATPAQPKSNEPEEWEVVVNDFSALLDSSNDPDEIESAWESLDSRTDIPAEHVRQLGNRLNEKMRLFANAEA